MAARIIKTNNFELATIQKGSADAERLALVLPGRLDTKDYAHMVALVDVLAQRGYLAVSFDPPGTWESPGGLEIYTMTNYLKAINELIEHFGNRPTLLLGHSRGSTMATLAATINPYAIGFVSIFCSAGPGSLTDRDYSDIKAKGYLDEYRDHPPGDGDETIYFKLPYGFFEDQKKYDLTDRLKSCDLPKLFVYGTRDEYALPNVVKSLYEVANDPKELLELDSDHDYRWHPELITQLNQEIFRFLDTYNL